MPSPIVGAVPRPRRSTALSGSTWRPSGTLANESDRMGDGVPDHVEKAFRSYRTWWILAHGFTRVRCSSCGHDFPVAFSCNGRGA
jgi:hypothetical protein